MTTPGSREVIDRREGRHLFGIDPAAYDAGRPGHPDRVYEVLVDRCGLRPGAGVLEIGPGTGQATRRLLELGADPLVAVEPDPALAAYIDATSAKWLKATKSVGRPRLKVRVAALEDVELSAATFDIAVAASSFHWVDEPAGLTKIAVALRPGGWWAMWWTLFGEGQRKDAFMKAIDPLFVDLAQSPSSGSGSGRPAFALDLDARLASLARAGFEDLEHELVRWSASWDTAGIRDLYATFSPISRLEEPRRKTFLDEVARVAERDFGGRVDRTLTTSLFTARRPR
jgi:SAM-dependent methyltransferase